MLFQRKNLFSTQKVVFLQCKEKNFRGNFRDLVIEQDLMRLFKVSGGMTRGRGITGSTMACFVNILPQCIPICDYLQSVVGVSFSSSEQHKDLRPSRLACDTNDLNPFIN